jgi:3-oxoacyl-(acyl-carrier-protein) synthase
MPAQAAVFDTLFATSTVNDSPHLTPRPFDAKRDGLVLGEGACTLVLEELRAMPRRVVPRMLGEIVGYGTNSDGTHVTQPKPAPWRRRCGWPWTVTPACPPERHRLRQRARHGHRPRRHG